MAKSGDLPKKEASEELAVLASETPLVGPKKGRSRKELYWGARSGNGTPRIRMSVPDRTSKSARPWNHPEVVDASQSYGVNFASYKQVHQYENTIEDKGHIEPSERFTCRDCGMLKSEHKPHTPEQLELF